MAARLLSLVFITISICGCGSDRPSRDQANIIDRKFSLKRDLQQYNGFYTSIESSGGKISLSNLPPTILGYKNLPIESLTLEYLTELKNGYLVTFSINYKTRKALVVATLDSEYVMVDSRVFTNGTGSTAVSQDTIATTSYHDDQVTIEIMHPNRFAEPDFKVDGIRREELIVNDKMKLVNTQK